MQRLPTKDYILTDNAKKGFDVRYTVLKRWRILSSNSLKVEVISDIGKKYVVDLTNIRRYVPVGDIRHITHLVHMLLLQLAIFMLIPILCLDISTQFSDIG